MKKSLSPTPSGGFFYVGLFYSKKEFKVLSFICLWIRQQDSLNKLNESEGICLKQRLKKGLTLWGAVLILLALLPMAALAEDAGDFSVTGGVLGTSYTYSSNTLTFLEPGDYAISMRSGVTSTAADKIVVNAPGSTAANPVHITLSGVDIQLSSGCAFEIAGGSNVRLTLSGDNRLHSGSDCAGLQTTGANLTIDAINPADTYSGVLAAEGGRYGAGIGGGNGCDGGTVAIQSGRIYATSGGDAAGLGGGFNGNGGTVVILGGDIDASGYSGGPGIGGAGIGGGSVGPGGSGGNGGSVTISGGNVYARGDTYAAGIGGGFNGSDGGSVIITGGDVIASGGNDGAGIGGGFSGNGGTIRISGGVLNAAGGENGAGLGGGNQGNGGDIEISGGIVTATTIGYGAAIGGGSNGDGGSISISATADVVARGDDYGSGAGYGAGLGGGYQGDGGTVDISGGMLLAVGGGNAAGIGGGSKGDGGTVGISGGTVEAMGTGEGAGIGGGSQGNGAVVTITGGSVVAKRGDGAPNNIGAGYNGSSNGTLKNGSGEDVYETSVTLRLAGADDGDGEQITSITIDSAPYPSSCTYADTSGQIVLYLTGGSTHAIEISTVSRNYEGTLKDPLVDKHNTLIPKIEANGTYALNDYYLSGTTLFVGPGINITLTDHGISREYFRISCGPGTNLTLSDVTINNGRDDSGSQITDESGNPLNNVCPLSFTGAGNVLMLTGYNNLHASPYAPGIHVAEGTELAIDGTGSLSVFGGYFGAGLGGGEGENGGDITINGGTLNVTGGHTGAGIGGGTNNGTLGGDGGTVTINGGNVTAKGGGNGAGIGGGYNGSNGTVVISGGTVRAYGGGSAAGIGGGIRVGFGGSGGTVDISGGTVTAEGGYYAAGIGGGTQGEGGTVTLTGGVVFAKGLDGAKDIGAGQGYSGPNTGLLNLSGSVALFLKYDNCVPPTTATHTHQSISGHDGSPIYSIPVAWLDDFGAYLRIYTLSYDLNGGTGTVVAPVTRLYNTTATVSDGSGLSRTYYTFTGWNTQANGGGTAYAAVSTFTFSSDTVLYAQWTATPATGTITGTVTDGANPVSGANVSLTVSESVYLATTTASGCYFILNVPAGTSYTVTAVKSGYTSGSATNVSVTANTTTSGVNITLTPIPSADTTATISVSANPAAGGTVTGGGTYSEGASVTVTAAPNSGYTFTNWTEGGMQISTAASYVFVMGTTNRNLTANFTTTSGGGGSGGSGNSGGGSGGSTPAAPTTPTTPSSSLTTIPSADGKTTTAATGVKPAVNETTGTATATVAASVVMDLAAQAKAAEAAGQKAVVEIKVEAVPTAKEISVEIPRDAFNKVAADTKANVTISTGLGTITFNEKAVDSISGAAGTGSVSIGIARVETSTLSPQVQAKVGNRPVYDFSVKAGSTEISKFNGGSAEISIPYTPKAGERKNAIVVYYIDNQGKLQTVRGKYDSATGTVNFKTTHFSKYAVGYNEVSFKDVAANTWYGDAVGFIAARGITTGTGNGNYSPEAKLTRGEFIVMMMRAYGIEPDTDLANSFSDAGNTYYTGYLAAAKRLGISGGVGGNMFAPGKQITRQEMFTLLYNALKVTGELPEGASGKPLPAFSDAGEIASWARDAMTLFVETGTIGGNGGKLTPADTTTRAQMAQVLFNLLAK
jgi:hypothetical protein